MVNRPSLSSISRVKAEEGVGYKVTLSFIIIIIYPK